MKMQLQSAAIIAVSQKSVNRNILAADGKKAGRICENLKTNWDFPIDK